MTTYELAQVDKDLASSKMRVMLAEAELDTARSGLAKMKKAKECQHKDLTHEGGYLYDLTTCKSCGYVWYD